MKRKEVLHFVIAAFIGSLLFISCEKSKTPEPTQITPSDNRVFISNEGAFIGGTGTVSIYYPDSMKIENEVFQRVNGFPVGNVLQSMEIKNGRSFLVVNNANKVEVVKSDDFTHIATISGIPNPASLQLYNESKAYVTSWAGKVYVVDLMNYSLTDSIEVGTGPEKSLYFNDKLYVLNQGGFSIDSTISVIDCKTDMLEATIQVAHKPVGIARSWDENLWVLCAGKGWNGWPQADDTPAKLLKVDPNTFEIEETFEFPTNTEHPEKFTINGDRDKLYYTYPGGIFEFDINNPGLSAQAFIQSNVMYYGLGYDPKTAHIFAADAGDFQQNGWVYRYDSGLGTLVDSLEAGIAPNGFYFN